MSQSKEAHFAEADRQLKRAEAEHQAKLKQHAHMIRQTLALLEGPHTVLFGIGGVHAIYSDMFHWSEGALGAMGRAILAEVQRREEAE
jgi:hypothetical protein